MAAKDLETSRNGEDRRLEQLMRISVRASLTGDYEMMEMAERAISEHNNEVARRAGFTALRSRSEPLYTLT